MPPISDIVDITITRDTQPAARSAFGIPLIIGESAKLRDKDEVVLTFDAQLVASNSIAGDVDGVAITPVVFNTTHDLTIADLITELLLAAGIGAAVASDVGGVGYNNTVTCTATNIDTQLALTNFVVTLGASQPTITIVRNAFQRTETFESLSAVAEVFATTDVEYLAAADFFAQSPNPGLIKIGRVDVAEDWDDALDAIVAVDDVWYLLIATTRVIAEQEDVADWCETKSKLFICGTGDANVLVGAATSDIAYYAENADYDRTAVIYHSTGATAFPEAAWAAIGLSFDPGTATWKFKELTGFAADTLTDAQRTSAVTTKSANVIEQYGDVAMVHEGTVASGEFIDIIRGIDWLESEMGSNIFAVLATAPKIPYTNAGIAVVEAEVRAALDNALNVGLLRADPDSYEGQAYRVTTKKVTEIDAADRSNRLLPADAITFDAKVAGAIHAVAIAGVVAV